MIYCSLFFGVLDELRDWQQRCTLTLLVGWQEEHLACKYRKYTCAAYPERFFYRTSARMYPAGYKGIHTPKIIAMYWHVGHNNWCRSLVNVSMWL